jgi:uncharacterized protein with GYD domain
MAKYLIKGSYSADGAKGLVKDGGTARRAAVEKSIAALGGKVESFYFTFGDDDVVVVVDAPDMTSAIALSLAVNATGAVRLKTTPLITAEEMDAASRKSVSYRAPGAQ